MIKSYLHKIKNKLPHPSTTLLLCILFFLLSNTTTIYGGFACESSPCSKLNDSTLENHKRDYFLGSHSYFFIAPTAILVPSLLKVYPDLIVKSNTTLLLTGFSLDRDDSNEEASWTYTRDVRFLPKVYFITKAVVFLSFPYWLFLIYLGKKYLAKNKVGKVVIVTFFVVLTSWTVFLRLVDHLVGEGIRTYEILPEYIISL